MQPSLASHVGNATTWPHAYLACCSAWLGNTCWKSCSGCCCEDLDFAYLRRVLMSHAHALDRLPKPERLKRGAWLMPEVYVAGFHATHHCIDSTESWINSKDPLGILALRLAYLDSESIWKEEKQEPVDWRDLFLAQETWGIMQLALIATTLGDLSRSGWPLLLLSKGPHLLWMSQMSGPLQSILKGGWRLFHAGAIETVAVATVARELPMIRRQLGAGYDLELRWRNESLHSTVLVLATARSDRLENV